jgi:hypothetical protein
VDAFCTKCGAAFDGGDRFCAKCGTARGGASPEAARATEGNAPATGPSLAAVIALVSAFVLVPALLIFGGGSCSGEAAGQVVVDGPTASFTFVPVGCASMFPYGRFGGNLHAAGPNDGGVYVTTDPTKGPMVEVEIPGSCKNEDGTDCTVFALPKASCETFDVQVERNGVVFNDVPLVDGHAKLGCKLEDGTAVTGSLSFSGC